MKYVVCNDRGAILTRGVLSESWDEAYKVGQRIANRSGKKVWLGCDGCDWDDMQILLPQNVEYYFDPEKRFDR